MVVTLKNVSHRTIPGEVFEYRAGPYFSVLSILKVSNKCFLIKPKARNKHKHTSKSKIYSSFENLYKFLFGDLSFILILYTFEVEFYLEKSENLENSKLLLF